MPVVALFVLSLLWGSTFYTTKMVLPDFHPVSIVFYRCLFGGIFLFPFFFLKYKKREFNNLFTLLGIALTNAGIPWILMSYSQRGLDTTISAVLNATGPVFGLLLSVLLLRVKINPREVFGVVLGFMGILITLVFGAVSDLGFQYHSAVLLLIAVCFYAFSTVLASKYLSHVSVYTLSFVTMVVGSIFSGIMMLNIQPSSFHGLADIENLIFLLVLGVLNSGMGVLLFFYIVKSGGPIFALLITFLMPITTVFLGVVLLDEILDTSTVIALLFVLLSIYVTQKKGGEKQDGIRERRSKDYGE